MLQLAELVKTWNALNYLPIAIKPLGSHVTGWDLDFGIGIFVLIYRGFWICLGVKYVLFQSVFTEAQNYIKQFFYSLLQFGMS